jgi:FkbM family methyltransferase
MTKQLPKKATIKISFCVTLLATFFSTAILSASTPEYSENWPDKDLPKSLIRDWLGQGDYLNPVFTSWINKDLVKGILEIGSRDAIDALDLSAYYKTHVYAFECNPEAIQICKQNIGNNPNITLVPLAAWNQTTSLSFFPVIPGGQVVSLGSSSLFKFDPAGPVQNTQIQGELVVNAIRLDEWIEEQSIENIDLICIDAQGATLQVVQGLEKYLPKVKYIIAEAEYQRYYLGEALYQEIEAYLRSQGFSPVTQINHHGLYADVLFVRDDLIPARILKK